MFNADTQDKKQTETQAERQERISKHIKDNLRILFDDDSIFEIRIPNVGKEGTVSGYFDMSNIKNACKSIMKYDGKYNIYFTLQGISKDLLSRRNNKLAPYTKDTTKDKEVASYRWFFIDLDAERLKGISSSEKEKELSKIKMEEIKGYLKERWDTEPLVFDSGNGYHLLYKISLPTNSENKNLIERALKGLGVSFSDGDVKIDENVFNEARITKLYGTMATKGDNTEDRPHRRSHRYFLPEVLKEVTKEQLEEIAIEKEPEQKKQSKTYKEFDLNDFISKHNIQVKKTERESGTEKHILEVCPFDSTHTGKKDAVISKDADGVFGFHCFHDSCNGNHWKQFRLLYEPDAFNEKPRKISKKEKQKNTPEQIAERKARAERIEQGKLKKDDWYDVNDKFLPRILGEYLAQTEKVFFMADSFYIYNKGYYKKITNAEVFNKIKKCLRENAKPKDIENVIEFWKNEVTKRPDGVNNNSKIISLKNTMLEIKENGEIETLDHTPSFFNTVQLNVNYNPTAKCEKFLKFLSEALTDENIKALQEIMGCLLTTETKFQKAFFFIGRGGCGKSTIIRVLQHIIDDPNYSTLSLQDLSDKFRAFGLLGKIANFYADLPDKPLEDSSTFKCVTGEDRFTIERKFGDPIEGFVSKAKLLFSCNQMPRCKDRTDGLYRRLYFIPFKEPLPESKRDGDLTNKLILEIDGIFNWALEGLKRVILRDWKIFETEAHKEKLKEYIGDNDNVIPFINECCVFGKGLYIKSAELYNEYKQYCIENGMKSFNSNNFFKSLDDNTDVLKTDRCRKIWDSKSNNSQWLEGMTTYESAERMENEARQIFNEAIKEKEKTAQVNEKCSTTYLQVAK